MATRSEISIFDDKPNNHDHNDDGPDDGHDDDHHELNGWKAS